MKKTKSKSKIKAAERNDLLSAILRSVTTIITPCSSYKAHGLIYRVLSSSSSACLEYVRLHESHYDAHRVTVQQLQRIAAQYSKLEDKMEAVEAEHAALDAKINRLRSQKKM